MAATLDATEYILIDNWPDDNAPAFAGPMNLTNMPASGDHNVASTTAGIPDLGTKFRWFQRGGTGVNQGWSTFIYLQMGTADTGVAVHAKSIVCLETEPSSSTSGLLLYKVTNDEATANLNTGLCAVAISAMTATYCGWFWCGGVCPNSLVTALDGNIYTDGNVVVGGMCLGTASAEAAIGFITDPANSAITRVGICLPATDAA